MFSRVGQISSAFSHYPLIIVMNAMIFNPVFVFLTKGKPVPWRHLGGKVQVSLGFIFPASTLGFLFPQKSWHEGFGFVAHVERLTF